MASLIVIFGVGVPFKSVPVAKVVEQYFGLSGYMNIEAMSRVLDESYVLNGAQVAGHLGWPYAFAHHFSPGTRSNGSQFTVESLIRSQGIGGKLMRLDWGLLLLLVLEPDFGQTLLVTLVWGTMFFMAGMPVIESAP